MVYVTWFVEICYSSPRKPIHSVFSQPSKRNAASGLSAHRTAAQHDRDLAPSTYPEFVQVTWESSAGQSQRIFSDCTLNWTLYHLPVTINIPETTKRESFSSRLWRFWPTIDDGCFALRPRERQYILMEQLEPEENPPLHGRGAQRSEESPGTLQYTSRACPNTQRPPLLAPIYFFMFIHDV